jgi:hypothetical protein
MSERRGETKPQDSKLPKLPKDKKPLAPSQKRDEDQRKVERRG